MAPFDQEGVVDSKLRVYGVEGLRVCDASIFPSIISGHTVSPSIFLLQSLSMNLLPFRRLVHVLLSLRNWLTRLRVTEFERVVNV